MCCDNYSRYYYMQEVLSHSENGVSVTVYRKGLKLLVKGNAPGCDLVSYQAPGAPDLRLSREGSGLPFPNADVAFSGSDNSGIVNCIGGSFQFTLDYPNSYYTGQGRVLVTPHILVKARTSYGSVREANVPLVDNLFENRSLTSLPGRPNRMSGR